MTNSGSRAGVRVVSAGGVEVCSECIVAATAPQRLRGLLGRPQPSAGTGLLLRRCASVHTLFLRYAIEVVFLSGDGDVLRVVPRLEPWHAAAQRGARSVLELEPGTCGRRGVRAGDRLVVVAA